MTPLITLDEACKILRQTPRALKDWLKSHPGCHIRRGRFYLFTDADITRIIAILREETECRSILKRRGRAARRTTASGALTYEQKLIRLREALGKKLPSESNGPSKRRPQAHLRP